jgi:hypothetical protein
MTIKQLEPIIETRHFVFTQVQRQNNAAIYSQKDKLTNQIVAYETILIKQGPPHPQSKSSFDLIEYYPSDKQFGVSGWSFGIFHRPLWSFTKAQLKFNQILTN